MKIALLILFTTLAFGFQEDDSNEGQAASCDNYKATIHKCMCARAMMCGRNGHGSAEPDMKCSTYCRPKACGCIGPCTSRH